VHISHTPLLLCDNLDATYPNPVYHSRMKHISIDIHFVCDLVQQGKLKVQHVCCTVNQLADCLTKPLSKSHHQLLRNRIGVTDGTPILWGVLDQQTNPIFRIVTCDTYLLLLSLKFES